jgi:hypothetical protein
MTPCSPVYKLVETGEVPHQRLDSNSIRIRSEDLSAFLGTGAH